MRRRRVTSSACRKFEAARWSSRRFKVTVSLLLVCEVEVAKEEEEVVALEERENVMVEERGMAAGTAAAAGLRKREGEGGGEWLRREWWWGMEGRVFVAIKREREREIVVEKL